MPDQTITVTTDHVKLLRRMEFDWDDAIEFGAVCSDFKRPYGNGGVPTDVAEILGCDEPDWKEAQRMTADLAAIVNALLQSEALDALVGTEQRLPWRAARAFKRNGAQQ